MGKNKKSSRPIYFNTKELAILLKFIGDSNYKELLEPYEKIRREFVRREIE